MLAGIDIGGTKIGVCLGSPTGEILADSAAPMDPAARPADVLDRALETIQALASTHDAAATIERLGVACPGPYDRRERRFLQPPNMPAWHGFDLGRWLDDRAPAPARAMNDANAAAWAEWIWGGWGLRHDESLVFLTCSTGLGAGIVIEGRAIEGSRGMAGEVGRIRLADSGPPGFGAYGTVEGFASGPGILQLAHAEARRCQQAGEPTRMLDAGIALDTQQVCRLSAEGDPAARRVTDHAAARLGELIAILANTLEPDLVVLGTIPAAHPALFIPLARETAARHAVPATIEKLRIEPSALEHRWQRQALAAATLAEP